MGIVLSRYDQCFGYFFIHNSGESIVIAEEVYLVLPGSVHGREDCYVILHRIEYFLSYDRLAHGAQVFEYAPVLAEDFVG